MAKYTNRNNCMAYAVGRSNWMIPKYWRTYEETSDYDDFWRMVETMARQFNFKLTSRNQMELGKEYVAFRVEEYEDGSIGDFHFMKRHKTGHWTHKMGGRSVEGISEKYVFSDVWSTSWHDYNGDLILFEKLS